MPWRIAAVFLIVIGILVTNLALYCYEKAQVHVEWGEGVCLPFSATEQNCQACYDSPQFLSLTFQSFPLLFWTPLTIQVHSPFTFQKFFSPLSSTFLFPFHSLCKTVVLLC